MLNIKNRKLKEGSWQLSENPSRNIMIALIITKFSKILKCKIRARPMLKE
jgi:hypothetical protein